MEGKTITAKWKSSSIVMFLSMAIFAFVAFMCLGFFGDYEMNGFGERWQMTILMTIFAFVFSLPLVFLCLWIYFWKLEIRDGKMTVFGFLKKARTYELANLSVRIKGIKTEIILRGKVITGMSKTMVLNWYEVVSAVEPEKVWM